MVKGRGRAEGGKGDKGEAGREKKGTGEGRKGGGRGREGREEEGCTFNGRQYVDGSEVISEEDPCLVCMCNAGTMTCMEMRCLATCDNPVTFPGQCCPICPTCRHRGRTYQDGDVFSPTGDPCDVCTCLEGTLRCRHQTCPELASCPQDMLQSPPPGECCPTCRGGSLNCTQRDVGTVIKPDVKDPCFYCECKGSNHWLCKAQGCPRLNCPPAVQKITPGECCPTCPVCHDMDTDLYYEEGDVWSDDNNPCKSCQCQQGRIVCRLFQCPPLRCSSRERMVTPPGQCCSICEPLPQIECFYQGIRRQPGERFKPDDCTTCDCLGGEVKCSTETCPPISCGVDEVPSAPPGACCPVCIAKPGTCIVFGDPHYQSFDGTMIHMQGSCKYIMTKDCENNDFTVEVQHDDRGMFGLVSWAQNFTVRLGGTQIDLLQQQIVQVDGRSVSLPYAEQGFSVERNRDTLLLNTAIGVQVTWNGDSNAEVSVPGTYKGKTCGLCGNFNAFPQDDLRTRSGVITNSPSVFGNSWKAPIQNNDSCADSVDIDPCVKAGYRARKAASAKCAVLTTSKFSPCHRVVAPDTFFASCVYDMCVCMDNSTCLCEILSSYAKECAKNGVQLRWREPGLCDFPCDTFKGFVFDECGPVCPRTCKNLYTPPENMEARCFKPCIASCQCPADKVLHNGECIPTSRCSTKQRGDITVNG
ncbi:hypothetical protein FSP39_021386 [Pinctada imbricata]|uniref:Kielin/chordin-like protein n=1 Tax=Pinctada imbricata TaxID=66713 RepID=A0AA88Y514_PINIB|nr:hypothetical protein FSP39_021386 [Pinctada imbricata]